jgi:hypothetical protein
MLKKEKLGNTYTTLIGVAWNSLVMKRFFHPRMEASTASLSNLGFHKEFLQRL